MNPNIQAMLQQSLSQKNKQKIWEIDEKTGIYVEFLCTKWKKRPVSERLKYGTFGAHNVMSPKTLMF